MFIGHFAAGMAGKKADPTVSLGALFLAAQFLDLLWPTLLILGLEHVIIRPGISAVTPLDFTHYPFSHSLLFVVIWGFLFGAVYFAITKKRKASLLLGLLVVSHWFLDLIVHIPDLPLHPGDSPKVGLGLWNSLLATMLVEATLFVVGILLYKAANKKVSWWFWTLAIFLVVVYVMNLVGPPPPNVQSIAWAGQLQWLFVVWAWWADKKSDKNQLPG